VPMIQVLSDLHCEFAPFVPRVPDGVDIVVLAGDIHRGTKGIAWARTAFPHVPIVYVAGNHEYYGNSIPRLIERLRSEARKQDVTFLENELAEIGGVCFLGSTLWTDLGLLGSEPWREYEIGQRMTDYRQIRVGPRYRRLRPRDTAAWHARSRSWLQSAGARVTSPVIVTHHAPSRRSLAPSRAAEAVGAAYASDLEADPRTRSSVVDPRTHTPQRGLSHWSDSRPHQPAGLCTRRRRSRF